MARADISTGLTLASPTSAAYTVAVDDPVLKVYGLQGANPETVLLFQSMDGSDPSTTTADGDMIARFEGNQTAIIKVKTGDKLIAKVINADASTSAKVAIRAAS